MKKKVLGILAIVILVTSVSLVTGDGWVALFYATVLAFFPQEIKEFFGSVVFSKNLRVSYAYLFRIELGGNYLLVKDERGNDKFQPVGGVYKHNSDMRITEIFNAEYDNVHKLSSDTENDLRLIIHRKDYKRFNEWFSSNQDRENINDLSREFKEELIDTGILDGEIFNKIEYGYIGSTFERSFNYSLKMWQLRRLDIVNLRLNRIQMDYINSLMKKPSQQYVFVRSKDIEELHFHFGGDNYCIASNARYIAKNPKLKVMDGMQAGKTFNAKISKSCEFSNKEDIQFI